MASFFGMQCSRARRISGLSGIALLATACVAADPTTAPAAADTRARIQTLIGTAPCTSDAQCRVLALGWRPCGGPEGHVAWSTQTTDGVALQALAASYETERRAAHEKSGLQSTCEVLPTPGVRCQRGAAPAELGRCVLVRQPPGRDATQR